MVFYFFLIFGVSVETIGIIKNTNQPGCQYPKKPKTKNATKVIIVVIVITIFFPLVNPYNTVGIIGINKNISQVGDQISKTNPIVK